MRVRQIILNFGSNGIKFTPTGEVNISVHLTSSDTLHFSIEDTGIGIEDTSILFENFVQADSSTTRRFGGTGLGLAISKNLVTLMGGEVGVRSSPGQGSHFWFTLPLVVSEPALPSMLDASEAASTPLVTARPGSALVVDDNAVNRKVARKILERLGWQVTMAEDGAAAVDAAVTGAFDIIFMDCQMPVLDGYSATQQIRAFDGRLSAIPIVAMTANALSGDRERCLRCGMNDYLTKPLSINRVQESLIRHCSSTAEREG